MARKIKPGTTLEALHADFLVGLRENRWPSKDGSFRAEAEVSTTLMAKDDERDVGEALAAQIQAAFEGDDALAPLTFVASTEAVGRDGDIIRAAGWDLDAYRKNPVFLWSHDGYSAPIGKVIDLRVVDGDKKIGPHLEITVVLDGEESFARHVHRLFSTGFLNAVSVNWLTRSYTVPTKEDRQEMGLGEWGIVIERAELLEVSAVTVPGDPDALMKRAASGLAAGTVEAEDLTSFATALHDRGALEPASRIRSAVSEHRIEKAVADDADFRREVLDGIAEIRSRLDNLTIPGESADDDNDGGTPTPGRAEGTDPLKPPSKRQAMPDYFRPVTVDEAAAPIFDALRRHSK